MLMKNSRYSSANRKAWAFSRFQRCEVLIVIIVLDVLILLIALAKRQPSLLPDFDGTTR